jgi:hypothetical protein
MAGRTNGIQYDILQRKTCMIASNSNLHHNLTVLQTSPNEPHPTQNNQHQSHRAINSPGNCIAQQPIKDAPGMTHNPPIQSRA